MTDKGKSNYIPQATSHKNMAMALKDAGILSGQGTEI